MRVVMSSAEIARVEELPMPRKFRVGSDRPEFDNAIVEYDPEDDTLFCEEHGDFDNCTCTSRVRLCGIITHTVTKDVLTRPKLEIEK